MTSDLYTEMMGKVKELEKCIKTLRRHGTEKAEAEKAYKIALRQECLKLRANGEAVGMINMVCYGIPIVAELRLKRDIADITYQANLEAINAIKLEIRVLNEQLSKEWGTDLSD